MSLSSTSKENFSLREQRASQDVGELDVIQKKEQAGEITRRKFLRDTLRDTLYATLGGVLANFLLPLEDASAGIEVVATEGREKETLQWEEVRRRCLENMEKNVALKQECTPRQLQELKEFLEHFSFADVRSVAKDIFSADQTDAEQFEKLFHERTVQSLTVFSSQDAKSLAIAEGVVATTFSPNHILFIAAEFFKEGKLDQTHLLQVLVHEYFHVLSLNHNVSASESIVWVDKDDISRDMYEGVTEVLALLLMKRMGKNVESYGYPGGNTLSAFYLGTMIGFRNLARAYFQQDGSLLKDAVDKQFGEHFFEAHLSNQDSPIIQIMKGSIDDLDGLLELIRASQKKSGVDYYSILRNARQDFGIKEEIHVGAGKTGTVDAIVSFIEERQTLFVQGEVVDPGEPLCEFCLPLKMQIGRRGSAAEELAKDYARLTVELNMFQKLSEASAAAKKGQIKDAYRYRRFLSESMTLKVKFSPHIEQLIVQCQSQEGKQAKEQLKKQILMEMRGYAFLTFESFRNEVKRLSIEKKKD